MEVTTNHRREKNKHIKFALGCQHNRETWNALPHRRLSNDHLSLNWSVLQNLCRNSEEHRMLRSWIEVSCVSKAERSAKMHACTFERRSGFDESRVTGRIDILNAGALP
jgi:hypothetical protein